MQEERVYIEKSDEYTIKNLEKWEKGAKRVTKFMKALETGHHQSQYNKKFEYEKVKYLVNQGKYKEKI